MEKKSVLSMVKDEQLIEKRRDQMIQAAVSLFKQKGFHRTTTREIAREAGFSIGTLYEYIRKKEDILYLVCDAIYDQFHSRMAKEAGNKRMSIERLQRIIRAYFKLIDHMQDEMLVMYQELKSLAKESLPYVLKKEMHLTTIFEDVLTECVEEGVLSLTQQEIKLAAHDIMVIGQMWAFRRWALHSEYTLEQYMEIQVNQLIKGMNRVDNEN